MACPPLPPPLQQLSALKAQRDLKSRELASLLHDRKAAVELSKVKELTLVDLTKQLADVNGRLRTFAAMYEVVKNERNTIANSIQTASQAIAEQVCMRVVDNATVRLS